MTHIGARTSRALFGALLVACGLLLWFAGLANASFDIARGATISIDEDTNWWNGTTVRSYGGYQYIAYWDAPDAEGRVYVKLTRRDLSAGTRESIVFNGAGGTTAEPLRNLNDGHDTVQVGLSPVDGRIHLDWAIHHDRNHWGLSSRECLTAARLTSCTFDWSRSMTPTAVDRPTGSAAGRTTATENTTTYPQYFNDADGNLYYTYRFGESFRGNAWLSRYNNDGTWTSLGLIIKGRYETIDWSGGRGTCDEFGNIVEPERNPSVACHRGVYTSGMQFDNHNRLHVMWEYKEYASALSGNGLRAMYYMYSDDLGRTWYSSAGRLVATANSDPLLPYTEDSEATKVYEAPFGQWPENTYMTIDSNNEPHLVFSLSDTRTEDSLLQNQRLIHIWRTGTNTWHNSWVEPAGFGGDFTFGSLVFDGADNAYYIYNHNAVDWTPWNRESYVYRQLPPYNVTVQSGDFLNIIPGSEITALDTSSYVNVPIGTRAGQNNTITVRMKNNTVGTETQFYFATETSPTLTPSNGQSFTVSANDTEYHTYSFRITDPDWTGTLRTLEIMPGGRGDVHGAGKSISIDYIRIGDERANYVKRWEFRTGKSVYLASSSADDDYSSWTIQELLPGFNDALEDAIVSADTDRYRTAGVWDFPATAQGAPGTESIDVHEFPMMGDTSIKKWAFPVDEQGWFAQEALSGFGWANDGGVLGIGATVTGTSPSMNSDTALNVPVTSGNSVTVRMKNSTTAREARFWFITNTDRRWNLTKTRTVTITPSSGYTEYTFDMSRVSGWNGSTLYQVALEPAMGVTSGSIAVDSISINR